MRIYKAKDYADMSRKAANLISAQIMLNPNSVLGLATGSSPMGIYRQLIEWYQKGDLDFQKITSINLDEYKGLSKSDPQSYSYYMHQNLFDHVNIDPQNIHIPDGLASDVQAECRRYDAVIESCGGLDIQLLGIGHNGHIGFNEPGEIFEKCTHCVDLSPSTIEANKRFFDNEESVPRQAFTMGLRSIMQARRILLIASGKDKAEIIKKAFCGPITPQVPASILQMHHCVTLVGDEAALSLIPDGGIDS